MTATAWTTNRETLVRELARARAERDAAHTELRTQRERNHRLTNERDELRHRLINAEATIVDLRRDLTDTRESFDRATANIGLREAEVTAALNAMTGAMTVLRRTQSLPVPDATRNRRNLEAALKETTR